MPSFIFPNAIMIFHLHHPLASKLIFRIRYLDIMCRIRLPDITQHDITYIVDSIRSTVDNIKCKGVVIGISGGVDSAVVTKLCA